MDRRKVLFIAYYFPPAGGGGVQRPTKFVKYLRDFGWEPIVVTATLDSYVETDTHLLKEIPENITIVRVKPPLSKRKSFHIRKQTGASILGGKPKKMKSIAARLATFLRNWLLIPDSQIVWVASAALKLKRLSSRYKPEIVFATAPPYSVLLLGVLAKMILKIPLVVDFRDPWSQYLETFRHDETKIRKRVERFLEKQVLIRADRVTSSTKGMMSHFQYQLPSAPTEKFKLIYNGFDAEDFEGIAPKRFEKFTIIYTGQVLKHLTSALPFLRSIQQLVSQEPELKSRFRIHFFGLFDEPESEQFIHENDLDTIIEFHGYIPHGACISYQLGADALIILLNEEVPQPIPGKIFEYLRAQKPILALIPENSMAAELLRETHSGIIIPPDETDRITRQLQKMILGKSQIKVDNSTVGQFNRKSQTRELASLFDRLCQDRSGDILG